MAIFLRIPNSVRQTIKPVLTLLLAGTLLFGQGREIPDLTPDQSAALAEFSTRVRPQEEAVFSARRSLVVLTFAEPYDHEKLQEASRVVGESELTLAKVRSEGFAKLQKSAGRLEANQVAVLIARSGARLPAPSGITRISTAPPGTIPGIREAQVAALTQFSTNLLPLSRALNDSRTALAKASYAESPSPPELKTRSEVISAAELTLAENRAHAFSQIQSSSNKLNTTQIAAFAEMGGSFAGIAFTEPAPISFSDHDGFLSLFDGVSLKGWDGNPKFWRVESGSIIGESTVQNPSGNSYIVYRDLQAKDFTLKFEIKVEGSGGSGFQYRSKTGSPWLSNIAPNVTANVGPVNLNWMLTGPQADFWPNSRDYSGQFYSENTPMRILAWRGQVVEGSGLSKKQLMGNIGDRQELGRVVKMNDWNEYTVIARGGTFIQIVNGQLMAVMVDDDPESSNNQSGLFGIEIEATTKVSVRNIWVKKFN